MNKPVAWLSPDNFFVCPEPDYQVSITTEHPKDLSWIPLYTHPVKDLEDIEINITWNETSLRDFGKEELAFAKAILRKAQEK